ncbi:MAG: hypothetical protein ACE5FH_09425, partial [Candidatus Zixiibacteriota bacterium]
MSKCRKNLSAWLIVTLVLMCSSLALFADIDRDADKAIRAEQLARTTTYLGATAPGLVLDPAVQAKMEAIAAEESKEAAQLAAEEALALDLQLQAEAKQAALDAEQASAKAFSDAERIWLSNQAPVIKDKPLYTGPHNVEDPMLVKQGGDDIATATVIPSLPYSNTGTTDGYADDYDETCPYNAPGSPDVVYS